MEKKLTELTRGEEEIMQILWKLGDAVVNEIIAETKEPHPKYTTVATFLKILENKGFVGHTSEGKSHRYHPLVGREEYARGVMVRWPRWCRSSRATRTSRSRRWTKFSKSCVTPRNSTPTSARPTNPESDSHDENTAPI